MPNYKPSAQQGLAYVDICIIKVTFQQHPGTLRNVWLPVPTTQSSEFTEEFVIRIASSTQWTFQGQPRVWVHVDRWKNPWVMKSSNHCCFFSPANSKIPWLWANHTKYFDVECESSPSTPTIWGSGVDSSKSFELIPINLCRCVAWGYVSNPLHFGLHHLRPSGSALWFIG